MSRSRSGGGPSLITMILLFVGMIGFLASLVAVIEFVTGDETLQDLLSGGDGSPTEAAPGDSNLPPATVAIASPSNGKKIAVTQGGDGRVWFEVQGTSSWVAQGRKLVLLLKPVDPVAAQWWIYDDITISSDGTWHGQAWYGTSGIPVTRGNTFDLQAVVTDSGYGATVTTPGDLHLLAQSPVLRLEVGQVN